MLSEINSRQPRPDNLTELPLTITPTDIPCGSGAWLDPLTNTVALHAYGETPCLELYDSLAPYALKKRLTANHMSSDGHGAMVTQIRGDELLVGFGKFTKIYSISTGEEKAHFPYSRSMWVEYASFASDTRVITADDGLIQLWDRANRAAPIAKIQFPPNHGVSFMRMANEPRNKKISGVDEPRAMESDQLFVNVFWNHGEWKSGVYIYNKSDLSLYQHVSFPNITHNSQEATFSAVIHATNDFFIVKHQLENATDIAATFVSKFDRKTNTYVGTPVTCRLYNPYSDGKYVFDMPRTDEPLTIWDIDDGSFFCEYHCHQYKFNAGNQAICCVLESGKYLAPVRFQAEVQSPFGFGSSKQWFSKHAILELNKDRKRSEKMSDLDGEANIQM